MKRFIQRFAALVLGVLFGFDWLRFRGTLRMLANPAGLRVFLTSHDVLLKDCMKYLAEVGSLSVAYPRQRQKERVPIVFVHVKGLAPPQGSPLIEPVIEAAPAIA